MLRDAREALDDQIERLEWALTHGRQPAASQDESDSDVRTVRLAHCSTRCQRTTALEHPLVSYTDARSQNLQPETQKCF